MQESTFSIQMNGKEYQVEPGQTILNVAQSQDYFVPSVCYHPNLGSIQTCDTCFVNVNGQMVRACTTKAEPGMKVDTLSKPIQDAQYEAMSRILQNHELYCTVCDNNNGNCVVHNTAEHMEIEHQAYDFRPKAYPPDTSHPFYRYDPDQCILCGRCVEACQDVQVNETLPIDWEEKSHVSFGMIMFRLMNLHVCHVGTVSQFVRVMH